MNTQLRVKGSARLALLAALFTGIALAVYAGCKVGDALPDLADKGLEGQLPETTKNKVLLLDFWASWCQPCAESFPVLEELHKRYLDQGLVIVGVSTDDKKANMEKFLKKHPVTFPIVRDAAQKLVAQVDVSTMPTSVLVDREGKIRFMHSGFHGAETKKQYIAEIESLLKGQP